MSILFIFTFLFIYFFTYFFTYLYRYSAVPLSASWLKKISGQNDAINDADNSGLISEDNNNEMRLIIPSCYTTNTGENIDPITWEFNRLNTLKEVILKDDVNEYQQHVQTSKLRLDSDEVGLSLIDQDEETGPRYEIPSYIDLRLGMKYQVDTNLLLHYFITSFIDYFKLILLF